eukprot:1399273-Prymnesium_polylepis.1
MSGAAWSDDLMHRLCDDVLKYQWKGWGNNNYSPEELVEHNEQMVQLVRNSLPPRLDEDFLYALGDDVEAVALQLYREHVRDRLNAVVNQLD